MAGAEASYWLCPFAGSRDVLTKHMLKYHKHHPSLIILFKLCNIRLSSFNESKLHSKKRYAGIKCIDVTSCGSFTDDNILSDCPDDSNTPDDSGLLAPVSISYNKELALVQASLLLRLQAIHKSSDAGLEDVIMSNATSLNIAIDSAADHHNQSFSCDRGSSDKATVFRPPNTSQFYSSLQTKESRIEFYRQHFNLIEPQSVVLGTRFLNKNAERYIR